MGSYQRFESGFFAKLYEPSPHGMNFTIGFPSNTTSQGARFATC
jgi:hypothetical protein